MGRGLDIAYAIRKKCAPSKMAKGGYPTKKDPKYAEGGMVPVPREKEDPRQANMAAVAEQARSGGSADNRSPWQKLKDSIDPEKAHRYAEGGDVPVDNTDPDAMNKTPNVPSVGTVLPAYGKKKDDGGDTTSSLIKMAPLIASMMSDEEEKESIHGAGDDMDDFLSSIEPKSFDYKDPDAEGADEGRQYGVVAQDLERSRAGSSVVDDTPEGKMVDSTHALGLTMGALGRLNDRVKKLESLKKFAIGGEVKEDDFLSDEEDGSKGLVSMALDNVRKRQTGR